MLAKQAQEEEARGVGCEMFVFVFVRTFILLVWQEIVEPSGDVRDLKQRQFIDSLRLERLEPANGLVHSVWESKLQNLAGLLGARVPDQLQEARIVIELETAPDTDHCVHGAPLVVGKVLCFFFDASSTVPSAADYTSLGAFVVQNPLPHQWRLCCRCQRTPWEATAVSFEKLMVLKKKSERMACWADLSLQFQMPLPLYPATTVRYVSVVSCHRNWIHGVFTRDKRCAA